MEGEDFFFCFVFVSFVWLVLVFGEKSDF